MIEEMFWDIFQWIKEMSPVYGPHVVLVGSFFVALAIFESTRDKYWGD